MPHRARRIAVALAVLALAPLLTACDQFLPEPLAFTRVGDAIVVRACIPMTVSSQTIEQEIRSTAITEDGDEVDEWNTTEVWSETQDLEVDAGTEFRLGYDERPRLTLEDWSETPEKPAPYEFSGESYRVTFSLIAKDGNGTWQADAWLSPGELAEGEWVDSYGDRMDPPCTHERCSPLAACWNDWPVPTGEPTRSEPTWEPTSAPDAAG